MFAILNKIWRIGVRENYPEYLNNKIRLTNIISFSLVFLIAIPFVFISNALYPDHFMLAAVPLSGIIVCIIALFLNYIGTNVAARLSICLISVILLTVYHAAIVTEGNMPIASSFMLQLSLSFIPFVIFDPKEWQYLMLCGTFNITSFLAFDRVNAALELPVSDEIFRMGVLGTFDMIVAVIIAYIIIYTLVHFNLLARVKNNRLLKVLDEGKKNLEQSEQKLTENIRKLKEAQEEETKRNWINEGLAKFGEILRDKSDNLDALSLNIISELTNYMDCDQAGMYIIEGEGDEKFLELKIGYAFNKEKYEKKRIALNGEKSKLSDSVREKSSILLKEKQENYLNISSGLGGAAPNTILITPIMLNDEIYGVIELGSFADIEPYKIVFLERLTENIASTISSVRVNETTKKLLHESQVLTEQMRSQEEEMRQNMEELLATQEEMERKNTEMETLIKKGKAREAELDKKIKALESR